MNEIIAFSPVGQAGGAENLLIDVLRQLSSRGHRVKLLVAGAGPLLDLANSRGVPSQRLPELNMGSPRSVLSCACALRSQTRGGTGPILLSHPKAHLLAVLAMVGNERMWLQLYDPAVDDNPIDRLSAKLRVRRIAIASVTANAYFRRARLHESQLAGIPVIPPAVDTARVRARASRGDAPSVLAQLGLSNSGKLDLVMVARLQRFKGQDAFIDLIAGLQARFPTISALIIGPDTPAEPGLRKELTQAIADRGLRSRVAIAGYVSDEDLAALVQQARILVHPASGETFGLVLVEALSLGTPVVAFAAAGPQEILRHGGGVLIPVHDTVGLQEAVAGLLEDLPRQQSLAEQGLKVAAEFDVGNLGPSYEALLGRADVLLDQRTTRGRNR